MADFIDWASLAKSAQDPSYGNIVSTLLKPQQSFRDVAGKEIMPLLQPGADPYLQNAINEIVRQGKLSKERSLADVTTGAQSRGLTGSSIESGDLAQTSTNMELGQQGQITGMLAQDAATKRQNMLDFLMKSYGMDYERANQISDTLAQVMGQELGRAQELDMFNRALKANKKKGNSFMQPLLSAAGGVAGAVYGGAPGAAAGSTIGGNVGSLFN